MLLYLIIITLKGKPLGKVSAAPYLGNPLRHLIANYIDIQIPQDSVTIQLPTPVCNPETRELSHLLCTKPFDTPLGVAKERAQSRKLQRQNLICVVLCELHPTP